MLGRVILISILGALMSACAQQSQVIFSEAKPMPKQGDSQEEKSKYEEVVLANAAGSGDLFALPRSKILVAKPLKEDDKKKPAVDKTIQALGADGFQVSVLPVEGQRFLVKPVKSFWSSTQIEITRIPNQETIKSVGVEFKDLTKDRIATAGSLVAGAIPVFAAVMSTKGGTETECREDSLAEFTLEVKGQTNAGTSLDGQPCWTYKLELSDPESGAIPITRFANEFNKPVPYFPVPACSDATLELVQKATNKTITLAARVAHPDYVRLFPLPEKGAITLHPVCGADVKDAGFDAWAAYGADLAELFKQAKAVEDALKNRKK